MAPPQLETSKLFACDIAAYSDAELDQYLEANGRFVNVEDPENLPEDFVQRLKARAGANDAAPSRSIDLNYVSARLVEEPVDRETSLRSPSPTTPQSIDEEEDYRRNLEEETEYYNKLINAGGRPSHPISLGYDVAKDLEEYREILSFWNPHPNPYSDYNWMVFGRQEHKWKQFRESQQRMRTDGPLEVGSVFPARPAKPGRFAGYCRGLHKRLARHGFERSFQLNEDPDRQDKLTTWIEYLGFEYVQYEKHTDIMKRLQQQYDGAWKKLVDSNVLKPSETKESLWTGGIGLQLKNEEVESQKAVESAISTVQSAEKVLLKAQSASLSKLSFSQLELKLSAARSEFAVATKSLEQISNRCKLVGDFHNQTKEYVIAKGDAAHQNKLLRWILQQVPLIELELNLAKATENDSAQRDGKHQRSLKRNRADDCNEEPVSKRQRQDGENHTLLESKTRVSTIQDISLTQQPRQTRSSSTLPSKPCSQRGLRASRPSDTKSGAAKSGVMLDDSAQVRKGRRRNKSSLGGTPDSRILRRSSRPRHPPKRFQ